jgi:hypothetical protein
LYNKELLIVAGVAAMRLAALKIMQKSQGAAMSTINFSLSQGA